MRGQNGKQLGMALFLAAASWASQPGSDWPAWRGVDGRGSAGVDLAEEPAVLWRADIDGRATPVVHGGKVFVQGRAAGQSGVVLAAFDAGRGSLVWRRTLGPDIADASPAVDLELGLIFAWDGASLHSFDAAGRALWRRDLAVDFGALRGAAGRVAGPVLWADLVLATCVAAGWNGATPRQLFIAFDKRTGETRYVGDFCDPALDRHPGSTPVLAKAGPRRLFIAGGADGYVYGFLAQTGELAWRSRLGDRALRTTAAVEGDQVFIAHDGGGAGEQRGALVCFDAGGADDPSGSPRWRASGAPVGSGAPAVSDGKLWVVDNDARLWRAEADSGRMVRRAALGFDFGGSPVLAGSTLCAADRQGRLWAFPTSGKGDEPLWRKALISPQGRFAQIFAAPAPAYDRLYLATDAGLYCLGYAAAPFRPLDSAAVATDRADPAGTPVSIQVAPAELALGIGEKSPFRVRAYDVDGLLVRTVDAHFGLAGGLSGEVTHFGDYTPDRGGAGVIRAAYAGVLGRARVRVFQPGPWLEDFERPHLGGLPPQWTVASPDGEKDSFAVRDGKGGKALVKPISASGLPSFLHLTSTDLPRFEIGVDVAAMPRKGFMPEAGVSTLGFRLVLSGNRQTIRLASTRKPGDYVSARYLWESDVWHSLKLSLVEEGDGVTVRGKVWPSAAKEPADWTLRLRGGAVDPAGAAALYVRPLTEVHFDNIRVGAAR